MTRSAGPLFACALALVSAQANAQAGATPPAAAHQEADQPARPEPLPPAANPPTADDICRTLEQAAAENGVPVEFFARVIWQESRFNARAVSPKGASGHCTVHAADRAPETAEGRPAITA
jgi:soluble lytic murein transglycosylase-like protein